MILSASRRTDIPALYAEWMMNRLRSGFVLTANPFNARQVSKVPLSPRLVDMIVFWSKQPEPMLKYLNELDDMGYVYFFQYTLTGFGSDMEACLDDTERRIDTFLALSERLGPMRVDWRFDPVLFCEGYPMEEHILRFERLARRLAPYTTRCIFSFADPYVRSSSWIHPASDQEQKCFAQQIAAIAKSLRLPLYTCCEKGDFSDLGIGHASCIDQKKIEHILGAPIRARKHAGQRNGCGCIESVDIGAYDTCVHRCAYCYATHSASLSRARFASHDPTAPSLVPLSENARISEKAVQSNRRMPLSNSLWQAQR